jgi:hypothetical protein
MISFEMPPLRDPDPFPGEDAQGSLRKILSAQAAEHGRKAKETLSQWPRGACPLCAPFPESGGTLAFAGVGFHRGLPRPADFPFERMALRAHRHLP